MYMRYLSDTHCELREYDVPHLDTDKDTILSLAGDIYDRKRLMPWLHQLASRFRHIVVVRGNHDYWNGSMDLIIQSQQNYKLEHNLNNVHILENSYVVIDDMLFYGGTMWTDYNKQDPLTKMAYRTMNDYSRIRLSQYNTRFNTNIAHSIHIQFKIGLYDLLGDTTLHKMPIFVISHHAPCTLSIPDKFLHDRVTNGFYASDLSELILDNPRIVQWHHGHMHSVSDYELGTCRMICNPVGYPGESIPNFDALKLTYLPTLLASKL